jgi:hypothetical protein
MYWYIPVCTNLEFLYWPVLSCTGTYWYIPVRTISPNPVQGYRIPDEAARLLFLRSTASVQQRTRSGVEGEAQSVTLRRGAVSHVDKKSATEARPPSRGAASGGKLLGAAEDPVATSPFPGAPPEIVSRPSRAGEQNERASGRASLFI